MGYRKSIKGIHTLPDGCVFVLNRLTRVSPAHLFRARLSFVPRSVWNDLTICLLFTHSPHGENRC